MHMHVTTGDSMRQNRLIRKSFKVRLLRNDTGVVEVVWRIALDRAANS